MSIKYSLYKSPFSDDPNEYVARVRSARSANVEDVIKEMLDRRSIVSNKSTILAVLELYFSTVEDMLLDGCRINTPIANYSTSIQNSFAGSKARFNRRRHNVHPVVAAPSSLRDVMRKHAKVTRQGSHIRIPLPEAYVDQSGERNGKLTPGGIGILSGRELKFEPDDEKQGIFFTGNGGSIRASVIATNKPSQLIFMVPSDLSPGEYVLEVHARPRHATKVRQGSLGAVLVVS